MATNQITAAFNAAQLQAGVNQAIAALGAQRQAVEQLANAFRIANQPILQALGALDKFRSATVDFAGGISKALGPLATQFGQVSDAVAGFRLPELSITGFVNELSAGIDRARQVEVTLARLKIVTDEQFQDIGKASELLGNTLQARLGRATAVTANFFTDLGERALVAFDRIATGAQDLGQKIAGNLPERLKSALFGNASPTVQEQTVATGARFGFQKNETLLAAADLARNLQGQLSRNEKEGNEQGLAVLTASLSLATKTSLTAADGVQTLTRAMQAFKIPLDQAASASNALFTLFNSGNISNHALADQFAQLGFIADKAGLSFQDTGAAILSLTKQGLSGGEAMTVLQQSLLRLANPSERLEKSLKQLGIANVNAELSANGLTNVLKAFVAAIEEGDESLSQSFGVRQSKAIKALVADIDGLKGNAEKLAKALGDTATPASQIFQQGFQNANAEARETVALAEKIRETNLAALKDSTERAKLAAKTFHDFGQSQINDLSAIATKARQELEKSEKTIRDLQARQGGGVFEQQLKFASGGFLNQAGFIQNDQQTALLRNRIDELTKRARDEGAKGTRDSILEANKLYDEIRNLQDRAFEHEQANRRILFEEQVRQGQATPIGTDVNGKQVFQFQVDTTRLAKERLAIEQERAALNRSEEARAKAAIEQQKKDQRELVDLVNQVTKAPSKLFDEKTGGFSKGLKTVADQTKALKEVDATIEQIRQKIAEKPSTEGLSLLLELQKLQRDIGVQARAGLAETTANAELGKLKFAKDELGNIERQAGATGAAIAEAFSTRVSGIEEAIDKLREFNAELRKAAQGGTGNEEVPTVPGAYFGGAASNLPQYFAGGGFVNFKPFGSDTVPAMLNRNEFVVREGPAQQFAPFLRAINAGAVTNDNSAFTFHNTFNINGAQNPDALAKQVHALLYRGIRRGSLRSLA